MHHGIADTIVQWIDPGLSALLQLTRADGEAWMVRSDFAPAGVVQGAGHRIAVDLVECLSLPDYSRSTA